MIERREYQLGKLEEQTLDPNPLKQFSKWFEEYTSDSKNTMNNAGILATASKTGVPTGRTVLLKEVTTEGFTFFSNYQSTKGKQLAENPHACLVFYWPEAERQVTICGKAIKVSEAESDEYFKSRPRHAQVAASCSQQSEPIDSRESLESLHGEVLAKYSDDQEIPRPKFWGGYTLVAESVEFWQGRENRLNDRILYEKSGSDWKIVRLQP